MVRGVSSDGVWLWGSPSINALIGVTGIRFENEYGVDWRGRIIGGATGNDSGVAPDWFPGRSPVSDRLFNRGAPGNSPCKNVTGKRGATWLRTIFDCLWRLQLWRSHSGRVGKPHLVAKGYDYLAGMVSGALGSAYNSHGVPVAVYGMLKQWPATHLRAILQAHFLCVGVLVVFSHVAAGFWSLEAVKVLLMVIPGLVLTVPLGNWIVDRMAPARAIKFVYGALIIFGLLLMLK